TINNPINSTGNIILGNRFGKGHKLGVIFVGSYQNIYKGAREVFIQPQAKPNFEQEQGTPNIYGDLRGNGPNWNDLFLRQYYTQETRYAAHANIDYKFNDLNSINFYTVYVNSAQQQVRIEIDTLLQKTRVGVGNSEYYKDERSILTLQSIYNTTFQGK